MALEQKILLGVCIKMVGVGMHQDLAGRVAKMGSIIDPTPHCPPMVSIQLSFSTPALEGDVLVPIDLLQHWKEGLGKSLMMLAFPYWFL